MERQSLEQQIEDILSLLEITGKKRDKIGGRVLSTCRRDNISGYALIYNTVIQEIERREERRVQRRLVPIEQISPKCLRTDDSNSTDDDKQVVIEESLKYKDLLSVSRILLDLETVVELSPLVPVSPEVVRERIGTIAQRKKELFKAKTAIKRAYFEGDELVIEWKEKKRNDRQYGYDPLEEYRTKYFGVTIGKLMSIDPGLHSKIHRAGLARFIPRRNRLSGRGYDPGSNSLLELELIIDEYSESVANSEIISVAPEPKTEFRRLSKYLRAISMERYIENPQVTIQLQNGDYMVSTCPRMAQRMENKVKKLGSLLRRKRKFGADSLERLFLQEKDWISKQQIAITEYVCGRQQRFLNTRNPLDLEPLTRSEIYSVIPSHTSRVSRLLTHITIKLPTGETMFLEDLIPGNATSAIKGQYVLQKLKEDPAIYDNAKWQVSDKALAAIIKDRFGLEIARRTINLYKAILPQVKS